MSEQIDWGKAPEGAMVLLKNVRDGAYAVSESYGDEAKTWHWPDPRYSFPLMPSMWRIVAERPSTPSWSGEGLPPVGTVCEVDGENVVIVAHHCNGVHAIYAESITDGLLCYGDPGEFRHIRTPEQIAYEERESAVDEMQAIYEGGNYHAGLYALYDAGYRKQ